MSYKLGLLLSMLFLMSVLLLSGDLVCISANLSELDSIALTAAYQISINGRIDETTIAFVEKQNASIKSLSGDTLSLGSTMVFRVYREYQPLIISKDTMTLNVQRSTVVGFLANE